MGASYGRPKQVRAEALLEAVKDGRLRRRGAPVKESVQRDPVLAILRARVDDEVVIAYLEEIADQGVSRRALQALAMMAWLDVAQDMDSLDLEPRDGYGLQLKLLETLRKLSEDTKESLPTYVAVVVQNADPEARANNRGVALDVG